VIKPYTFFTKAGSDLTPISTKAEIIGLYIVNLFGKC